MSRVVRRVGRAISKAIKRVPVLSTIARAVSRVGKKLWRNKFVRAVVIAAGVYLTAGAALGAMGVTSAGAAAGGGWAGAQAGLSAAWGGLTGAAGSALSGNFAQAGSQLAGGLSMPAAVPSSAVASLEGVGAATQAAAPVAQAFPVAAPGAAQVSALPAVGSTTGNGLLSRAMQFASTPGGGLVTSAGLKLAGGAIADRAVQKAQDEELERVNRNQNMANVGAIQQPGVPQQPGRGVMVPVPEFDPRKYQQGLVSGFDPRKYQQGLVSGSLNLG